MNAYDHHRAAIDSLVAFAKAHDFNPETDDLMKMAKSWIQDGQKRDAMIEINKDSVILSLRANKIHELG